MKKVIALIMLAVSVNAYAEAPWVRDCVKWYGAEIPVEERTPENCPSKISHWELSGTAPAAGAYTVNTGITQVNLPSGGYLVQRTGSTVNVIQTSKSR